MSSQAFFWVNVGLGLILILFFLIGKRGVVPPSKLNLRRRSFGSQTPQAMTRQAPAASNAEHFSSTRKNSPIGSAKNLNTIFMYNGHNFDAYEVLGAPAGASFEMVERYYQTAITKDGSDKEFLAAAMDAIRRDR